MVEIVLLKSKRMFENVEFEKIFWRKEDDRGFKTLRSAIAE